MQNQTYLPVHHQTYHEVESQPKHDALLLLFRLRLHIHQKVL